MDLQKYTVLEYRLSLFRPHSVVLRPYITIPHIESQIQETNITVTGQTVPTVSVQSYQDILRRQSFPSYP